MAIPASSRRGKPARLLKKGTATTKSHRFEPFSQRVVKLKIDPIHRARRTPQDGDGADTTSHFRTSLEHWIDMNLSENFTRFAGAVNPLCESLPQILHYEDRIMGLLVEYIEKRDELCMEPLLDLVAQFARDLGQRFERHFASTVTLVANVAATHSSIEVIEWSFTCLAWIFKFLSRLLVPDLRQLLSIMSPYLGKEKQKHFVTRFAAESMSFLIRKAALVYYKNQAPLEKALTFLINDLSSVTHVQQAEMYQEGLMSMLSESIKGVKYGLYSNGTDIMRAIIFAVTQMETAHNEAGRHVLEGVLINIIHSTTLDTFPPILDIICEQIEAESTSPSSSIFKIHSRMLFLAVVTRKGVRVKGWKRVHTVLLTLLDRCLNNLDAYHELVPVVLGTAASAMQTSPMDELLPSMRPLMSKISDPSLNSSFLPFCSLFADLGLERFQSVVLPYFQKYISANWRTQERELCVTLPKLLSSSAITFESNRKGSIIFPESWAKHIGEQLANTSPSTAQIPLLHAYTQIQYAKVVSDDPSAILKSLHSLVKSSLDPNCGLTGEHADFGRGHGFLLYCEIASQTKSIDRNLWSLIETHGAAYTDRPAFLEAVLEFVRACPLKDASIGEELEPLAGKLLDNLSSPSHELRVLSLQLLRIFSSWIGLDDETCIPVALEIEESELTLETERHLNMQLRKLAIGYKEFATKKWLDRLLPYFCFGILSKRLGTLVDTSCEVLKTTCEIKVGEDLVSELAVRFFTVSGTIGPSVSSEDEEDEEPARRSYSEYECFNVTSTERHVSKLFSSASDPQTKLSHNFILAHAAAELIPQSSRSKALKVLNAVPHVAERRSRQIVPHFLSWATKDEEVTEATEEEEEDAFKVDNLKDVSGAWNQFDRKAMLTVFSKFVNPRVIYKASDVHEALMTLLTSGDAELQKLALKALFTWKSPSINPYQENLLNILDEKRLKDELTVFVHVDEESTSIEPVHRSELMPLLFRLLYGRIVSRSGSRTNRGTQEGRRKMILRTLSQLPDFGQFVHIAYGALSTISVVEDDKEVAGVFQEELLGARKQFGLLKMIETMLETLGVKMLPFAERTMNVVLYCLVRACRQIGKDNKDHTESLLRSIRQAGVHCLDLLFYVSPNQDWSAYVAIINSEVIKPRLNNFAIETAQGVSGLLQIFKTWSLTPSSALYFLQGDHSIIIELVNVLAVESARDEVKVFVMEQIVGNLLDFSSGKKPKHMKPEEELDPIIIQRVKNEVLAPHVEALLVQLENLLRTQLRRQMTLPAIDILARLAPFVQSSSETTKLVRTATYLLQQPADRVPPKAKSGLLGVLEHFLPLYNPIGNEELNDTIYETISSLFDYFKDEPNRKAVSVVFSAFAEHDKSLKEVALLCEGLNSLSERKLESIDYEKRLAAFRAVNEEQYMKLNARQWRPLLYNFLYHVKDEDELAIRSSASFGIRRFVERSVPENCGYDPEFAALFDKALLPALRNGAKSSSEIVRVEFVQTMGYAVSLHIEQEAINDMQGLLAGGDDEASFFTNILHIQQHRRTRALRRLASESAKGTLRAYNIATFFMPLIEHFVFDQAEDENAHNLAAEAISAIGQVCAALEWNQFRAIYRRYKLYVQTKAGQEKNVLRLLGRLTDSLSEAMKTDTDAQMVDADEDRMDVDDQPQQQSTLARTLPGTVKIADELKTNFIPFLTKFTHLKDESEVNLRLPAAVIAVKLLKLLSEEDASTLLPPVLLDVSNVLRSRSQEARDIARKTLSDIALILGPPYFGHILKELRSTLQRGYQLHVLSYTVHSILVSTSDHFKPGDLDNDLEMMADIIVEDIFGTVGQEKEAEEYVSKMKEVKSSKSYDSMELLAKNASIKRLAALTRPIQMLLQEKLTSRIVLKVDELLRRIGIGLVRNPGAETRDTLIFSYELIKEANQKDETPNVSEIEDRQQKRRARFLINLRSARNNPNKGATTAYTHKLARFGLDILRALLNKFGTLLTIENITGFLPVINDALVQAHEEVKLSAMRVLSVIIKLPLAQLDQNSEVYLVEAIKMIRESPTTNTEAAQVALKFIATIIRERKVTKLKDSHLAYLLKRISTDIDDPDRQGIAFNFIRAVMSRRFVVPELYSIIDSIAAMMVTNQTRSARDLARGVYVHFTIAYPQAKSRWNKQLAFLAKNLDYKHMEGRQSVMDAIHMLLSKIGEELAQDMIGCFFVPLVMEMTNDESLECREMAGTLLKEILERADSEQLRSITTPLHAWLEQVENPILTTTGLQTFRLFFESGRSDKEKEISFVLKLIPRIIRSTETKEEGTWEVLSTLCSYFIWVCVVESLFYPHTWVRTCAANLIGLWFADEARTNAAKGYADVPLLTSSGLTLESSTMMTVLRASFVCLRAPTVTQELATQVVRNLVFLGRCFAQNNLDYSAWKAQNASEDDESDEEIDDVEDGAMASTTNGGKKSAIQYIFERATGVLRREIINTRVEALFAKTACMKLIAALCSQLDNSQIQSSLQTILLPLIHLTDPSIPAPHSLDEGFREAYKALVSHSQEILDVLQKKFGTTDFVAAMTEAKERVIKRRDERRVKRKIEAISDPVRFGAEKRRRHDRKREKRKEKGHGFQNRRRGW
ncbi:hypothetical protein KEM56_000935 [Ascosphaera pollenicola]|nr:hypothetical protein KEM56_000935 [Ascosphaera pollenicola]